MAEAIKSLTQSLAQSLMPAAAISGAFARVPARIYTMDLKSRLLQLVELLYLLANADGVVRRKTREMAQMLSWGLPGVSRRLRELEKQGLVKQGEEGWELVEVERFDLRHWKEEGRPPAGEKGRWAYAHVPLKQIVDGRLEGISRRLLGWYRVVGSYRTGVSHWSIERVQEVLGGGIQQPQESENKTQAAGVHRRRTRELPKGH